MIGKDIKEIIAHGNAIKAIYYGSSLIWSKIKEIFSCYGSGKWLGDKKWTSNDKWKSN